MEQRSGNKKQKSNKLMGCLGAVVIILVLAIALPFILGDKSKTDESKGKTQSSTSGDWSDADKSEFLVIAEKYIKQTYAIDNFKIDDSSDKLKVYNSPTDVNAETGEEYKNIINGISEFTYQDKVYPFTLLYNKIDKNKYSVLYLYSNYDSTKGIDVPLKSEQ